MTRQNISIGSSANDGTGDTLRTAGTKINENFVEIYQTLSGDSDKVSASVSFQDSAIRYLGSPNDAHETFIKAVTPTADRTITFPNLSGGVVLDSATQTLTNKQMTTIEMGHASDTTITRASSGKIAVEGKEVVTVSDAQTLLHKTIGGAVINEPTIGTAIRDSSSNELISFTKTSSAVNHVNVTNKNTNNDPIIAATGSDTNVNLSLAGKGKGSVLIGKAAYSSDTITANGAADSSSSLIICNKGSALAVSLGNGSTVGEFKIFTNKGAGAATITPFSFAHGTSFTIQQYKAAECVWDGTNWYLLAFGLRDSSAGGITIA